jgi:hypothetical protein
LKLGLLGKLKVNVGWQLVNNRADSLEVNGHPYIVDVLRELVGRPLLFAIQFREAEVTDWVAVGRSVVSVYHRIMTGRFCLYVREEGCKMAEPVRYDRLHCMVASYALGTLGMTNLLLGVRGKES